MTHARASSEAGFTIRAATSDDGRLLADFGARLFAQAFGPANTPENMQMYLAGAFSEPLQQAELADPSRGAWIATDVTGSVIGYAMVRRGTRGDGVVFRDPFEVQRIYVEREWLGRGVGGALMEICVDDARRRRCDGIWLCVWEENLRAIAFYKRVGFLAVGTTTFTLGRDVQQDIVMARSLE